MQPARDGGLRAQTLVALFVAVVLLTAIVVHFGDASPSSAETAYAELRIAFAADSVRELGELPRALRESSGLAVSRDHPGIVWSHNDSGDDARFYAIDQTGAIVAIFDVEGVEAQDWESMDIGPCPTEPGVTCLFLADTGDNVRRRDLLTIHVVPEPDPRLREGSVEPLGRIRYLYPDRPRDAEGVAVSPSGEIVIVTKGRAGNIMMFSLVAARVREAIETDEPVRLGPGTRLSIEPDWDIGRVVTGASFHPDGDRIALRTLSEIYFFNWPAFDEASPPCFLGRREPQGEGIGWEASESLVLTSETTSMGPGTLLRVWCGSA